MFSARPAGRKVKLSRLGGNVRWVVVVFAAWVVTAAVAAMVIGAVLGGGRTTAPVKSLTSVGIGDSAARDGAAVDVGFDLTLRRVPDSVEIVRHVVAGALEQLGVADACVYEVEVLVSEACGNAVIHAIEADTYSASLHVTGDVAVLRVCDDGPGFDPDPWLVPAGTAAVLAREGGCGIMLMRALADEAGFRSRPGDVTAVELTKVLSFR